MSKLEIAAALVDLYEAPRPLDPHWNAEVGRLVLELNSGFFFPNIVNALNGGTARAISLQLKPDGGTWRATLSDPMLFVKAQNSGLTPAELINLLDELLAGWKMETSPPLTKAAKRKLGDYLLTFGKQALSSFEQHIPVPPATAFQMAIIGPWFKDPHPELLTAAELEGINLQTPSLGMCSCILALMEAHPDYAETWRDVIGPGRLAIMEGYGATLPADVAAWNDHHMARWFIFGDNGSLAELRRRYQLQDEVGQLARWMIDSVMQQCELFRVAFTAGSTTVS